MCSRLLLSLANQLIEFSRRPIKDLGLDLAGAQIVLVFQFGKAFNDSFGIGRRRGLGRRLVRVRLKVVRRAIE